MSCAFKLFLDLFGYSICLISLLSSFASTTYDNSDFAQSFLNYITRFLLVAFSFCFVFALFSFFSDSPSEGKKRQ